MEKTIESAYQFIQLELKSLREDGVKIDYNEFIDHFVNEFTDESFTKFTANESVNTTNKLIYDHLLSYKIHVDERADFITGVAKKLHDFVSLAHLRKKAKQITNEMRNKEILDTKTYYVVTVNIKKINKGLSKKIISQ